ncbi:hypothetical protein N7492_003775 [Penicillium capsulatum]|uniref:Uncharacterized protein n=1 Tax=Penicillium capsulatum TaxID=69766 RepID=A0A9W9LWW5_9EURO|nr:hypothetical protein N7492_003775 [Penicillium capsulatum]KAJ6121643.1 hypothetical protein N7512_004108 [Penicillium capsulatum]
MAGEKSKTTYDQLGYYSEESPAPALDTDAAEPPPYTPTQDPAEGSSSRAPAAPPGEKPIAIPAIGPAKASPFLRAYAPILHNYKLPKDSFLSFLDQLNDVMGTSPPMQVIDAAGGILQSVPLFPIQWIGSAVSGIANMGGQGISKSRSDSAIRQANKEIFGPRGLKVEIAKLDALAHIGQIPILDSQGKINKQAPLMQELNALSNDSADEAQELDLQQRRLRVLQPWIAALEVEVLPWTSKSRLTRFNAALKKRNNPDAGESQRGKEPSDAGEDTGFRKCLWLVIRGVGDGEK